MYPEMEEIIPEKGFKTNLHKLLNNDQPFVISGYRKMPINSVSKSFLSFFYIHNETLNILTHLFPIFLYLYMIYNIFYHPMPHTSFLDHLVLIGYLCCCNITMIMSSLYHLFRSNSEEFYHWFLMCDIRGIVILVAGCNYLSAYYEFRDSPMVLYGSFSFITILLVMLYIWIYKMVKFRLTKERTIYFALFSLIGFTCWAFNMYILKKGKYETFWPMLNSYISTLIALIVKELKLPERFFPYTFDIVGASHQIFHVIAVYGAWILIDGYLKLIQQGIL